MFQFIKKLFKKPQNLGLLPLPEDKRDYLVSNVLGWFGEYKTKQVELTLPIPYYKNQYRNTCTFNSGTEGKEVDEGLELSVRNAVKRGTQLGLISGDGFSNLRTVELVKKNYGICEAKYSNDNERVNWEQYSKPIFTEEENKNAELHKSSTFLKVNTIDQLLKFLDEGRTVRIGMKWQDNFNSALLSPDFILNFSQENVVGGHAVLARGYKDNGNLIRFRNSYGQNYGLEGDAYIKRADLQREMNNYGAFVDWDMPKNTASFLNEFNGCVFRENGSANLWKIENGKKRFFKDTATMYAHSFTDEQIKIDEGNMLLDIEKGEDMDFWAGESVMAIKALILRAPQLKSIFGAYFTELFK